MSKFKRGNYSSVKSQNAPPSTETEESMLKNLPSLYRRMSIVMNQMATVCPTASKWGKMTPPPCHHHLPKLRRLNNGDHLKCTNEEKSEL